MAVFPKSKLALELSLKRELEREKEKLQRDTEEWTQQVDESQQQFQEDQEVGTDNDNQDNDGLEASVVASLNNTKQEERSLSWSSVLMRFLKFLFTNRSAIRLS